MPVNRYQIRNVYSLADPELYKAADKDDPEALLEGVAMAGLVGVLRQLGDLAEFAAEIFHDLHEEVIATATRGHGLLLRVQQLESEIPPIERAFLSQTSHSAFFPNSGIDWHPNQKATQNLITTGDLPRFVMDSYEECRGPPRLFLLDKFDVGGAGACLKRYTDPSIFKMEASSDEIEVADSQRDKKIHQKKKKGSGWKGGETPVVSQPSHAKLHQLFLEERVQTGATEAARRVKLKKRPKKFLFDSESGERYMNKLLNEVSPVPSNGSRLEDSSIRGSALGLQKQNTSPCVSLRKVAESQPSNADFEADDNQRTVDDGIHIDGLQNDHPSEDVASETDNYMDALATMESEIETGITQGTYSDANKNQFQLQLLDSQSIENSIASNDGNNSITKAITVSVNFDTTSTSTENTSPAGADSSPQPFACIEIPFRPRVLPVADNIPVTQNPGHNITNDTFIDTSKVSNVDQVSSLDDSPSDSNEVCSNHTEKLDSPQKSENQTSEHTDVLPIADGLSSFSLVRSLKGDLDNKYPDDSSIPMILLPDILETTKNQGKYDVESLSTDSVVSSSQSVISRVNELSSDTTSNDNIPVTEDIHEEQSKEKGDGVLVISDQAEARVLYSSGCETEPDKSEIEPVTVADANTNECSDYSVLKEGTGAESEERKIESTYSDVNRDSVNSDTETSAADLLTVDVDKHEDNGHSVSEQDSKESDVDIPSLNLQDQNHSFLAETDQKQEVVSNVELIDSAHEAVPFTESDNDLASKSLNDFDILEAAQSSPFEDQVDQSNSQLHMQLPLETEGSQLGSLTQVGHDIHLFDQVKPEDLPPLPPLPPMQWRMRNLQNSSSTQTNGGEHGDKHFPPIFPSTSIQNPQMVGHSTTDETINLDTENQNTQHDRQLLSPDSKHNEVIFAETLVPQAAVETHRAPTISDQEFFWPSSSPYPLPPVLDEMQTNIRPMKVQRPRSPLIDAVASHDKTKLRKVSDRDTTQIPKGEERDTLLDQIRAKSINLKPAVQTRPIIQGPNTNLRVAAILEKANAIRQAFAGSDDDDDDSDNWSDSSK